MTILEKIEHEAEIENVEVIKYPFTSDRIKGLYADGTIALNNKIETSNEKTCILAEELGHFHTTTGDILDQSSYSNRKQEFQARLWAYNKLIGLRGIIDSYCSGCRNTYEMAENLNVTEEFLLEALDCYKNKYGICATIDNYVIYFYPTLGILEII